MRGVRVGSEERGDLSDGCDANRLGVLTVAHGKAVWGEGDAIRAKEMERFH